MATRDIIKKYTLTYSAYDKYSPILPFYCFYKSVRVDKIRLFSHNKMYWEELCIISENRFIQNNVKET